MKRKTKRIIAFFTIFSMVFGLMGGLGFDKSSKAAGNETNLLKASNFRFSFKILDGSFNIITCDSKLISDSGGTYTFKYSDEKEVFTNVQYVQLMSDNLLDKGISSLKMTVNSFKINGSPCPINSNYKAFVYNNNLTIIDAQNTSYSSCNFNIIDSFSYIRKSIFTNITYENNTFNYSGVESSSTYTAEISVTFSDINTAYSTYSANDVEAMIDAIGTVTLESESLIETASNTYNYMLSISEQSEVQNISVLQEAIEEYDRLVKQAEKDAAAVAAVEKLISAIGNPEDVEYTTDYYQKIEAAQKAYINLREEIRADVSNISVLEAASKKYYSFDAAIFNVRGLISDIGTVEYTEECYSKIEAAEKAYQALDEDLKAYILDSELTTLSTARSEYEALKAAAEKEAAEKAAAEVVEGLINAIGTVEYTDESLEKIEAAEDAYDKLTDDQKALISNYDDLTAARSEYDELKAE
ncbi:MAG: hypothetical protein K6F77_07620, partial [Lachnospiraceae bacterium]|nr:hypothetical protein [Lachnospiraceae bacterium]